MNENEYWKRKIAVWLKEPVCKIFDIKKMDDNAQKISKGISDVQIDEEIFKTAARMASGLTHAAVPGRSESPSENGEVIFADSKTITHPLVKNRKLEFDFPKVSADDFIEKIKEFIDSDIANISKTKRDDKQIFNYLFFALSKRLRNEKIGGWGALWDVIPADTRIPDHTMWNHLGLTSAIYSSMKEGVDVSDQKISMVVFSITPVQDFISKARKLRDYWTGSVILSYLAFSGLTTVMEELGADHVLYPSLQNQFLVEKWLDKKYELEKYLKEKEDDIEELNKASSGIAAFPNKFVFICNENDVEDICAKIEKDIRSNWSEISIIVKKYVAGKAGVSADDKAYSEIWDSAINDFWKYSWASCNFVTINNKDDIEKLLPEVKYENDLETMEEFNKYFQQNDRENAKYDVTNLYGTTHSLVQGLLAASKNKPAAIKKSQNGEKCPLCGEHEVLNNSPLNIAASDYNKNTIAFWDKLRESINPKPNKTGDGEAEYTQIGKNERLCAVCTMKRLLPMALKTSEYKTHLLHETLAKADAFPSTTEMAAYEKLKNMTDNEKKKEAQKMHDGEFDVGDADSSNKHKYYALLLMDGDKMGDLINGETLSARWYDVLAPELSEKFASGTLKVESPFKGNFIEKKRTMNPALHAMISDSLNNFARYGVQPAVEKSGGRLIYAGGDDVCAILPLRQAFNTADTIRKAYTFSFAEARNGGAVEIKEKATPDMKKIALYLGSGAKKISLSGAIIIAHHKQPLKEVIQDAHHVLDSVAKEKSGRNSLAIRLKKRSGGDRDVWFKWGNENIFFDSAKKITVRESFEKVMEQAAKKELSASLLYNIENLKGLIEPIVFDIRDNDKNPKVIDDDIKDKIISLFKYEISHSGMFKGPDKAILAEKAEEMAKHIAGVCIKIEDKNKSEETSSKEKDGEKIVCKENWFNPESCIIANFIATQSKSDEKKGAE